VTGPGDERPPGGRQDPAAPAPPGQFQYGPQYGGPGAPTEPPYVYNPYGNFAYPSSYPSPAGLGAEAEPPPKRPGSMHLALLLVVVSAVPYLFGGLVAVAGAGQAAAALTPENIAQLEQLGVSVAQFTQVVRVTGVLLLAFALAYVLLGVLAWTGRRWARGLLAATTVGFALMAAVFVLVAGSQGLAEGGVSVLVLALPLAVALAGVGLMFGGAARDWFARRR
jgi:hypothetical protein